MTTWSISPDIECPSCGQEFYQADYFELKVGAEVTCRSCGKTLKMTNEEVHRSWAWEVDIDPA